MRGPGYNWTAALQHCCPHATCYPAAQQVTPQPSFGGTHPPARCAPAMSPAARRWCHRWRAPPPRRPPTRPAGCPSGGTRAGHLRWGGRGAWPLRVRLSVERAPPSLGRTRGSGAALAWPQRTSACGMSSSLLCPWPRSRPTHRSCHKLAAPRTSGRPGHPCCRCCRRRSAPPPAAAPHFPAVLLHAGRTRQRLAVPPCAGRWSAAGPAWCLCGRWRGWEQERYAAAGGNNSKAAAAKHPQHATAQHNRQRNICRAGAGRAPTKSEGHKVPGALGGLASGGTVRDHCNQHACGAEVVQARWVQARRVQAGAHSCVESSASNGSAAAESAVAVPQQHQLPAFHAGPSWLPSTLHPTHHRGALPAWRPPAWRHRGPTL